MTSDRMIARRSVVVGGLMALTAGGAYAAAPRRTEHRLAKTKLGDLIPRQIGAWRVATPAGVIVSNEEATNSDGYDQLLTRTYQAPGLPVIMLLIAYGSTQGGTLQLHRPETCYPSQGFSLNSFQELSFPFLPGGEEVHARRFTARRGERVERLVYWTRIAQHFPLNTAQEYRAIISSVLRGVVPDGILVRISSLDPDIPAADAALTRFAQEMVEAAKPMGRQILLG